ncbi:hypothetical protein MRX96_038883 [Rhipicephalus microplus]
MGQTKIAKVYFKGLKVPRYVRFYGVELRSYLHRLRQVVCKICHKLGHLDDHCPTQDVICTTCGIDNPTQSHPFTPHFKSCDGPHPTTDPNCLRRERQALNMVWVRKAFENELCQLQPCTDHTASNKAAETRHSRTPMKAEESRCKSRSKSHRKSNTCSKSRTRFKSRTRSQSRTRLESRSCSMSRSCSCEESQRPSE